MLNFLYYVLAKLIIVNKRKFCECNNGYWWSL